MKWQLIITLSTVIFLQSCSKTITNTYWVGGEKKSCVGANAERDCLQVLKSENLADGNWETFYSNIDGFEFEEGYMQKIQIKEEKIENPPADASSIRYTQVKQLERIVDYRTALSGDWLLAKINGGPINRMVVVPTLNIDFNDMVVSGNGGCNQFFGDIKSWTDTRIVLGGIAATKKLCNNRNIEDQFYASLDQVYRYELTQKGLSLINEQGEEVLFFIKQQGSMESNRIDYKKELSGDWSLATINGGPINRLVIVPNLSIDFNEMRVYGNGGCNDFNGEIESWTDSDVSLGGIISTSKLCINKNIEGQFYEALNKVAKYKLDKGELKLMDENGKELLHFIKQSFSAEPKQGVSGIYAGEIPCADCRAISQSVFLKENNTFEMESIYLGKGNENVVKRDGTYYIEGDMITLMDDDWKQSYKYDGMSLLMLDKDRMEIKSDLNYRLDMIEAMPDFK